MTNRLHEDSNSQPLHVYVRALLFARISRVPGARMWAISTPDGLVPLHTNRAVAHAKLETMREVARVVARLACVDDREGGTRESDVAAPALPSSDARAADAHDQSAEGAALVVAAVKSSAGAIAAPLERNVRTAELACPRSFRYRDGSRDVCTPRVRDGRCIWCERELAARRSA